MSKEILNASLKRKEICYKTNYGGTVVCSLDSIRSHGIYTVENGRVVLSKKKTR
ncbi:MAG: hypothetical protein PHI50_04110 [Alphaproteobacteria bacterium]|nr:hypothetical protein [Alphaproteobacteria bacterium]